MDQTVVQNTLREKFVEQKAKNPSYSLRAYALRLGINSGALSGILNGKRRISAKMADRIIASVAPDPEAQREIWRKLRAATDRALPPPTVLDADRYRLIAHWIHFAILSLLKTEGFRWNTAWIAQRLAVSSRLVHDAIERMVRVEILRPLANGDLVRTETRFHTSDEVACHAVRESYVEDFELAKAALFQVPLAKRDFTATTFAIAPDQMAAAKRLIRKFHDDMEQLVECAPTTEVYKLSVQFYPLTEVNGS